MLELDSSRFTVLESLKKMKIRRQLSLRGLRITHSHGFKESDEEIYRAVQRSYRREARVSTGRYEKVLEYINDIFGALANYDVRFAFDPMSMNDDRCEILSASELKLICEMKHISKHLEVDGDGCDGTVKIRLQRDDVHRYDIASWNDVCSARTKRDEPNFLNTRKILDVFSTALGRAVRDVWNKHRNIGLVYRVSGNQARIYVDIPDTGYFTVTLVPAIKVTNTAVKGLNSKSGEILKGLEEKENFISTIYALVQPNRKLEDEFWHLSYKNLENRILNSEQFSCGRVWLHALRHLLRSSKSPRSGIKALTLSHLQLAVIQEYTRYPGAKDWTPAKFVKRLTGMMTSLVFCLKAGICVDPFSGANVFSEFDVKSSKVLAKDVENASTRCRERLLRVCN